MSKKLILGNPSTIEFTGLKITNGRINLGGGRISGIRACFQNRSLEETLNNTTPIKLTPHQEKLNLLGQACKTADNMHGNPSAITEQLNIIASQVKDIVEPLKEKGVELTIEPISKLGMVVGDGIHLSAKQPGLGEIGVWAKIICSQGKLYCQTDGKSHAGLLEHPLFTTINSFVESAFDLLQKPAFSQNVKGQLAKLDNINMEAEDVASILFKIVKQTRAAHPHLKDFKVSSGLNYNGIYPSVDAGIPGEYAFAITVYKYDAKPAFFDFDVCQGSAGMTVRNEFTTHDGNYLTAVGVALALNWWFVHHERSRTLFNQPIIL